MLHAVFSFTFRNPCLPAPVPTEGEADRRNLKSAFEYANFFMDAIGVLTKLLCNLFNFDPKNGVLSLKSASLF
jgi:hypothetical protein